MKLIIDALTSNPQVSDYKVNITAKESYELFFVKGKLETVRATSTCDKQVTVYADHGECKGDSQFFVYPSTTQEELTTLVEKAVEKALLINNKTYTLPENEAGCFEVPSNFQDYELPALADTISKCVFRANTLPNADLNSVEVFVNRYTETVRNSRGIYKTQVRYDAMVEAIPTYNGENESVELYQQYNFSTLDEAAIEAEIREKLQEVKARYEAVKADFPLEGNVILNKLELSELFSNIAYDLNYGSQYSHASLFHKGDAIQKNPTADKLCITMAGLLPGNIRSACFDSDGMALGSTVIVEDGVAVNYFGANRFGQYMGEIPTGNLRCLKVAPGTAKITENTPGLEVVSMSGLQVDFYNDYIGGEVRLAYYRNGEKAVPVTGISITGKLSQVLSHLQLSEKTAICDSYEGPDKAILSDMKIF